MTIKARLQDGSVIVEVNQPHEGGYSLLTVSKARYDEDAVQVKLSAPISIAVGALLCGVKLEQEPDRPRLNKAEKARVVESALLRLQDQGSGMYAGLRKLLDDVSKDLGDDNLAYLYDLVVYHAGP